MRAEILCPNKIGPYQLRGTIGSGAFATCKLAYRPDLDIYYACKIIARQRLDQLSDKTRFEQEIRIQQELRHPRIVQLYDLYKDALNYYVLMEYCPNGELLSYIVQRRRVPENEAKVFFKNIMDGLLFIHSLGIAHRDLKPENVLLDLEGHAKISDFGLGKYVGCDGLTSTSCGSPCYVAPEVLTEKVYNAYKCDMWSCGVILYVMVTGQIPWARRNHIELFEQIKCCSYRIPAFVSGDCAELIRGLMTLDPQKRLTIEQVLAHPWMVEAYESQIVWKEVPIVSLRRLDRFFDYDMSQENIKLAYRPSSTGKRRVTFQKEERMIRDRDEIQNTQERELTVKASVTMYKGAGSGVPECETAGPVQVETNWKDVVRQMNRKPGRGKIIRPKMKAGPNPLFM